MLLGRKLRSNSKMDQHTDHNIKRVELKLGQGPIQGGGNGNARFQLDFGGPVYTSYNRISGGNLY